MRVETKFKRSYIWPQLTNFGLHSGKITTIMVAKYVTPRDLVIHILTWTGRVATHNAFKC